MDAKPADGRVFGRRTVRLDRGFMPARACNVVALGGFRMLRARSMTGSRASWAPPMFGVPGAAARGHTVRRASRSLGSG